jgi:16S rRNA (cytosine967-C5)-methyltransferase
MNSKLNPRKAALDVLLMVENGAFISDALNQVFGEYHLSELDKALAAEIAYGTVRMQKSLDYLLNKVSRRRVDQLQPNIRSILRLGAYQLEYLERIPPAAAVNESVKLIPKKERRGAGGFVNAVLRNLIRKRSEIDFPSLEADPVRHIAVKYSHPEWMVKRWVKRWGELDSIKLCETNNLNPKFHVRVNTLKITRDKLKAYFLERGINAVPAQFAPDVLICDKSIDLASEPYFQAGYYYIQNESSALAAHALGPRPGETVYDLCAAPGGKSTHLAQLMDNEGRVLAVDQTEAKTGLIRNNAERLGVSIIDIRVGDAAGIELPQADRVLVDAPCSGLGVLRHKPDARWHKTEQNIFDLAEIQRKILGNAARLVKPGGILVYSTCTLEPEENEDMIAWLLEKYPSFQLSPLPEWFPPSQTEGMLTILPFVYGIDGFFICKLANNLF